MTSFQPQDLWMFVPELTLVGGIVAIFLGEILVRDLARKRWYVTLLALLTLGLSGAAAIALWQHPPVEAFSGQLAIDPLATFFKMLFVIIGLVAVITSLLSKEITSSLLGEYHALLLAITFGMFLMASANDLLSVYLGIEMVSIVSFALAGYRLRDRRSSEAALKYVIFGGAASGIMLFGISIIYGLFGTTHLGGIHRALVAGPGADMLPLTFVVGVVFVLAGVGFKIAVVPFHMWSPDVYEGAPTPFSGFLSVGPKAAGFALLVRLLVTLLVPATVGGEAAAQGFVVGTDGIMPLVVNLPLAAVLGIVAAVTMTLGNLAAIPQNNVKRLLAYSSIAHAGYLLMGVLVLSSSALHAVLLYLVFYFLMNIGAFTVVQAVRDRTGGELMHDFRGLGTREPLLAAAMTVFLLSLTGIPPLAGFIGKFYLFASVLEHGGFWYLVLALVAVVNSAVSLFYYMRIVKAMYLTTAETEEPLGVHRGYLWLTGALALPTLILGLYWAPLSNSIRRSLTFYRSPPPIELRVDAMPTHAPSPTTAARTN